LNITSIATKKFVVSYDNFGHSKTADSKAMHCCRSVRNHKKVGNTFMVGGENSKTSVIHFDANAKYEAWLLEGQGVFDGHSDAIRHVEANSDGSLMLSSCADHSLRIWDMNTYRCLALFSGHTGLVSGGAFLNSTTIVSSSWD